ncbi:unnamed protein product [Citrullus colocynthis]|uniref:Uncharacterized protein n=1 Tax=Citrullus colocynthis TaxID=252529 RepID=A0ABP0YYT9_9ROSI
MPQRIFSIYLADFWKLAYMKRRRTMLPGFPENGRADYEEAFNDFLCPQMVNDAIQAEKAFIFSSPGMPALAFLEEVAESVHVNDIYCVTPLQRLIKMVNEMSPNELSASVSDIDSLVCMTDRVPSLAPLNNSKAAVSTDFVGADASPLRRICSRFGGTIGSRRTRHYTRLMDCEGFDLNSRTIETPDNSHWRGFSLPTKQSLFEEIRRINEQLIDTVVSVCDKDTIAIDPAATIDRSEGIIVKCSFVAHSNLTSHQTSALQFNKL